MEQTALIEIPTIPEPVGDVWRFRVVGKPIPQGSMVPFIGRYDGKARLKASNKKELNAWRDFVGTVALACRPPWLREPWDGPVWCRYLYVFERSPNDYLADGTTLRKGVRRWHDVAPDRDKLDRAMNDALAGIAFTNDGRNFAGPSEKCWGGPGEPSHVDVDLIFIHR